MSNKSAFSLGSTPVNEEFDAQKWLLDQRDKISSAARTVIPEFMGGSPKTEGGRAAKAFKETAAYPAFFTANALLGNTLNRLGPKGAKRAADAFTAFGVNFADAFAAGQSDKPYAAVTAAAETRAAGEEFAEGDGTLSEIVGALKNYPSEFGARAEEARDFVGQMQSDNPFASTAGQLTGAAVGLPFQIGKTALGLVEKLKGSSTAASGFPGIATRYGTASGVSAAEGMAERLLDYGEFDYLPFEFKNVAADAIFGLAGQGFAETLGFLAGGPAAKRIIASDLSSPLADPARRLGTDDMLYDFMRIPNRTMFNQDTAAMSNLTTAIAGLPIDDIKDSPRLRARLKTAQDVANHKLMQTQEKFVRRLDETLGSASADDRRAALNEQFKTNAVEYKSFVKEYGDNNTTLNDLRRTINYGALEGKPEKYFAELPEGSKLAIAKVLNNIENKAVNVGGKKDRVTVRGLMNVKKDIDSLLAPNSMLSPDTSVDKDVRKVLRNLRNVVNDKIDTMSNGAYKPLMSKYATEFDVDENFDRAYEMIRNPLARGDEAPVTIRRNTDREQKLWNTDVVPWLNNASEYYENIPSEAGKQAFAEGIKSAIRDDLADATLESTSNIHKIFGTQLGTAVKQAGDAPTIDMKRQQTRFTKILSSILGEDEFNALADEVDQLTVKSAQNKMLNEVLENASVSPISADELNQQFRDALLVSVPMVSSTAQMYRPSQLQAAGRMMRASLKPALKEEVVGMVDSPAVNYRKIYDRAHFTTHKGAGGGLGAALGMTMDDTVINDALDIYKMGSITMGLGNTLRKGKNLSGKEAAEAVADYLQRLTGN